MPSGEHSLAYPFIGRSGVSGLSLNQQVQIFGGPSASSFGEARRDTITPTGQSFCAVSTEWPLVAGGGPWFGVALPDGVSFAFGSMTLTNNELNPTMLGTVLYIWNTVTQRLQAIPVPTSAAVFNPPNHSTSGSSGSTIDMLRPITINGVNHVYAFSAFPYTGWQISVYGEPYQLLVFTETNGVWAFDESQSMTPSQLAASSAAGASAFPTSTNSYGETYYQTFGAGTCIVMPQSGHLVWGNYFLQSGHNSGSLVAFDPVGRTVKAFYQYPDATDINCVPLKLVPRDLVGNPWSPLNDERFIMTPDVFVRSSGAVYSVHPLIEMSYHAEASTLTVESPPVTPYNLSGLGYSYTYGLAQYDASGNLWCPTHGGSGFNVFNSHELHFFEADGNTLPTLEKGGSAADWNTTQFPTTTKADFRFGGFAITNGIEGSVNYDPSSGRMLVVSGSGVITAGLLSSPLSLGPQLAVNGDVTDGTTGWGGYFSSLIAQAVDSDFASGYCLLLTSDAGRVSNANQSPVDVTPGLNYIVSAQAKGVTTTQPVEIGLWWYDDDGGLITTTTSPTLMVGETITYIEVLDKAPAGAVTVGVIIHITASSVYEQFKVGTLSIQSCPCATNAGLDTNKARFTSGANSTNTNKGQIVNDRLIYTVLNLPSSPTLGEIVPHWLVSTAVSAIP